jgi:hypothetical protein
MPLGLRRCTILPHPPDRLRGVAGEEAEDRLVDRVGVLLLHRVRGARDPDVLALGSSCRFNARLNDPAKQWKLSGMDLEARRRWVDYAEAKDDMFSYTDTRESPWYVVEADDSETMRLNLISHLLSLIPYEDVTREKIKLPPRQKRRTSVHPRATRSTSG